MDFSAREDIEAPIDFVFKQITNLASFERSIMRRGGDVVRLNGDDTALVGTKWDVKFRMRGKERQVDAEITQVDAPNAMTVGVTSSNVKGDMVAELVALSPGRTRLIVRVNATPKSIAAKVLFQSIRFARAKTDAQFKQMVANYAEDCEKRYKS